MKRFAKFLIVAAYVTIGAPVVGCGGDDDGMGTPIDAAGAVDGALPPDTGGMGITAPEGVWSWVSFPGTRCMNGSETGLGVNLKPSSDKVLIYLEGGGACFNSFTCSGVAHQNGFGEAELGTFAAELGVSGIFNRADADNPFKDWNLVFVPYCSGDIFAGNAESGSGGRVQVGWANYGEYLTRLVPTFATASQVVLVGSSAGGFGAAYNFDRTQQAFGSIPVTLLDDSGPPLSDTYLTPCLQGNIRTLWNLDATLPEDCTACREGDGGLVHLATYLAEKYPDRRFGLISSLEDGVIRLFYGWGYPNCANPMIPMPPATFSAGLRELSDTILAPYSNFKVFYLQSQIHVWLFENPVGGTVVGNVKLTDWLRGLVDGGAGWDNVLP